MRDHASYQDVVAFHGHSCPGLALGYRMATEAAFFMDITPGVDEEYAAISESGFCGVDALQIVTGCTLGRGNLRLLDIGKRAFVLIDRARNRACRATPSAYHEQARLRFLEQGKESRQEWIVHSLSAENVVSIVEVSPPVFDKAVIEPSVPCAICNEPTMASRLALKEKHRVCAVCRSVSLNRN